MLSLSLLLLLLLNVFGLVISEEPSASKVAGHQGRIRPGTRADTIMKMVTGSEQACLEQLQTDELAEFVPKLYSGSSEDGFLEMQDLLAGFEKPSVMDVKIGVRTFREEELSNSKARPDLFKKMAQLDAGRLTATELRNQTITKARYMMWRDSVTSSSRLGFRLEGIHYGDGKTERGELAMLGDEQLIREALERFVPSERIRLQYLARLRHLKQTLLKSRFFRRHELVGSSLLFVHDQRKANIWMIDFAQTCPLPEGLRIAHYKRWRAGNHEDGYLIGVESLIELLSKNIQDHLLNRLQGARPFW